MFYEVLDTFGKRFAHSLREEEGEEAGEEGQRSVHPILQGWVDLVLEDEKKWSYFYFI